MEKEPQETNELQERVDAFIKEYGELVEKHQIDMANYPVYIPDGNGGFKTIIQNTPVDMKNRPQVSPFIKEK